MASSLIDAIKETIIGVKSNTIDGVIDRSLESISQYSSNSDTNKYLESMKNLVSSSGMSKDNSVIKQLDQGAPQVQNFDQSGRVARYAEYDAVCTKIAYVQRAIKVLTDHIIAPDDILKYALQVIPVDRNSKETKIDIAITRIKEIIKHFKLENKIKNLVFDTLKYGDNFVEIVPVPKGKNALVVINEGMDYNAFRDTKVISETNVTLETTNDKNVTESKDIRIIVDESIIETLDDNGVNVLTEDLVQSNSIGFGGVLSSMSSDVMTPYGTGSQMIKDVGGIVDNCKSKDNHTTDTISDDKFKSKYSNSENQDNKKEDENRLDIKDVNIVIHDPRYVIRLETERFKVCLGFLVFPKVDPTTLMSQGVNTNIDSICANFLGDIESKLKLNGKKDNIKISDDIRKVLLAHLSKIKRNEDLKVRYVAPEYMEHFRINVSKYAPYGESILDSSLYDCKLLMALKTAAAIKKINACTDKRFVSVEVGLPRDAKNVVQKMEEILTKKRVSIGSMGAIDTIPSQISTLETIFLPMKDGKKFVEIDHQNWGGDTSNDTDNQKQMRDGIVANLGVPPIFVGLEENQSNRSSATTESISFCRTIIDDQKELSIPMQELITKVYRLIFGDLEADILSRIQITFSEPKVLPNTAKSEYLEAMQRNMDAYNGMGIPKSYLQRKFLPDLEWNEIENAVASEKLDAELNDTVNNGGDIMGGMNLGTSPSMGGMPGGF